MVVLLIKQPFTLEHTLIFISKGFVVIIWDFDLIIGAPTLLPNLWNFSKFRNDWFAIWRILFSPDFASYFTVKSLSCWLNFAISPFSSSIYGTNNRQCKLFNEFDVYANKIFPETFNDSKIKSILDDFSKWNKDLNNIRPITIS